MIVLTKFQRREINAGRRVDLRLTDKPPERAGHSYAVLAAAEKGKGRSRTSLRVEVMASAQVEGGWVLSLKMAPQRRRLLHRDSSHGYTENAAMALQGEPEAVDEFTQERITKEANERDELRDSVERPGKYIQRDLLRRRNKLLKLQAEARRNGIDISPELDEAIRAVKAKLSQSQAAA